MSIYSKHTFRIPLYRKYYGQLPQAALGSDLKSGDTVKGMGIDTSAARQF